MTAQFGGGREFELKMHCLCPNFARFHLKWRLAYKEAEHVSACLSRVMSSIGSGLTNATSWFEKWM
jgi:hypothetical protein